MFSIEQITVSIFSAILISAITSLITVRLALKQFYSERWWVRKDEAYTSIIDALSDLVSYYDAVYDEALGIRKISDQRRKEMNDISKERHAALRKVTNIGAFVISKDAELVLKQYWQEPKEKHDPNDWMWEIENDYAKAKTALEELVKCAKKDLSV
jgi:hypothetical protein